MDPCKSMDTCGCIPRPFLGMLFSSILKWIAMDSGVGNGLGVVVRQSMDYAMDIQNTHGWFMAVRIIHG